MDKWRRWVVTRLGVHHCSLSLPALPPSSVMPLEACMGIAVRAPPRVVFAAGVEGEGSPSGLPVSQMLRTARRGLAAACRSGALGRRRVSGNIFGALPSSFLRADSGKQSTQQQHKACNNNTRAARNNNT